jgi:hypothetical protein
MISWRTELEIWELPDQFGTLISCQTYSKLWMVTDFRGAVNRLPINGNYNNKYQ